MSVSTTSQQSYDDVADRSIVPNDADFIYTGGFLFFMRIFLSLHAIFHDRPDTVHQNAFLMVTIWVLCKNFPFKRRSINVLLLRLRDLQKLASYRRKWGKNREEVFQWILRPVSFDFYHFYEQSVWTRSKRISYFNELILFLNAITTAQKSFWWLVNSVRETANPRWHPGSLD